ncbi:MAG: S-methyl-5-thioribose-1-phosphate isomerase [Chloroflexi bacterium]|nr:MAG: S-methyl-5-thioribose-1-phosphate isomerase [Chloroflexota bacterium]
MQFIEWVDGKLRVLDQTRLPLEEVCLELCTWQEVALAIREMKVRGAPMIGIAAAYAIVLGVQAVEATSRADFLTTLEDIAGAVASTRPTAVNLFQAVRRMRMAAQREEDIAQIKAALITEARSIQADEEEATRRISLLGARLIDDGSTILTHCNAGALATGGHYGTALGMIKAAREQGRNIRVLATETRPLLQGARLTTWELLRDNIPVTLITDSMAGYYMKKRDIDCVVVGADRIAANGDVANKIGTYTLAVLASENSIPFYVAAPSTSVDLSISSGQEIPIEFRSPDEVTHVQGVRIAPEGVEAASPAFDVTPHDYVSAIITEKGIVRSPYAEGLSALRC